MADDGNSVQRELGAIESSLKTLDRQSVALAKTLENYVVEERTSRASQGARIGSLESQVSSLGGALGKVADQSERLKVHSGRITAIEHKVSWARGIFAAVNVLWGIVFVGITMLIKNLWEGVRP